MIKSELVAKLAAENPHLYRRDAEAIVDAILDTITAALARGDRVELRGFGMFTAKKRSARTARNPRNRKAVVVPEKLLLAFKPSKDMHRRLNGSAPSQGCRRIRSRLGALG
jgi:integration host factor subunit beta